MTSTPSQPTPSPDPRKALERAAETLRGGTVSPDPNGLPTMDELAPHFDEFEFEGSIGHGGMGVVFRARHLRLNRPVAIKVLPPRLQQDPSFEERFEREGRALAQLDHPNVLRVFDFGERAGFYYLVTEFVDGLDLRQLLGLGRVSTAEALDIVPQICAGLSYAHSQGIIHRDVKPENILVDQEGEVTIVDFGLAKLIDGDVNAVTLTSAAAAVGTPHYMAPEQLQDPSVVDHRADLFSLGVVFYELLTGRLPMGRFEPPSARAAVDPSVATKIDRVVMKSLAEAPGDRHQSADAFQQDLSSHTPLGPTPRTRTKRERARSKRLLRQRNPYGSLRPATVLGAGTAVLITTAVLAMSSRSFANHAMTPLLVAALIIAVGWIFGMLQVRRIVRGEANRSEALSATLSAWLPPLVVAEFALILGCRPLTGGQVLLSVVGMAILDLAIVVLFAYWLGKEPNPTQA